MIKNKFVLTIYFCLFATSFLKAGNPIKFKMTFCSNVYSTNTCNSYENEGSIDSRIDLSPEGYNPYVPHYGQNQGMFALESITIEPFFVLLYGNGGTPIECEDSEIKIAIDNNGLYNWRGEPVTSLKEDRFEYGFMMVPIKIKYGSKEKVTWTIVQRIKEDQLFLFIEKKICPMIIKMKCFQCKWFILMGNLARK